MGKEFEKTKKTKKISRHETENEPITQNRLMPQTSFSGYLN